MARADRLVVRDDDRVAGLDVPVGPAEQVTDLRLKSLCTVAAIAGITGRLCESRLVLDAGCNAGDPMAAVKSLSFSFDPIVEHRMDDTENSEIDRLCDLHARGVAALEQSAQP